MSGTGTLVLTGVNTYTGTTTVEAGTLDLDNAGTIEFSPEAIEFERHLKSASGRAVANKRLR